MVFSNLKRAMLNYLSKSVRIHPSQMTMHDAILYGFTGGASPSASGTYVNETMALNCAAVFACIKVLSEDTASLPLLLYRRLSSSSNGKERATSHPLFPILHLRPNQWMSSMQYREVAMHHLLSWGNHYSQVVRLGGGTQGPIAQLVPLRPDRMEVIGDDAGLVYRYTRADGSPRVFDSGEILHVAGLGFDGIIGYSPIAKARETIGLSMAVDEFGARFFGNGANSSVVLSHPTSLSKQAKANLRDSFDSAYKGVGNSHKTIVLEEGIAIEKLTIPPDDAQFLATRRYQKEEIASIYRVPPYLLQDYERATFSNVEHTAISYVVHSLRPWFVRLEQAMTNQLLTDQERDSYFIEHLVAGLMRGDIKSRYDAYAVGRQWGWLSANDIRDMENLNPIDDGDIYLQPLNMVPAGTDVIQMQEDKQSNPEPDVDPDAERQLPVVTERSDGDYLAPFSRLPLTYFPILHDSLQRSVNEEVGSIRKQLKHTFPTAHSLRTAAPGLEDWITQYYLAYRTKLKGRVTGPFLTYLEQVRDLSLLALSQDITLPAGLDVFPQDYIDSFVTRYTTFARNQLADLIHKAATVEDIAPALTTRLDEWVDTRAEKVARDEATRMLNAMMRETWRAKGVRKLKWVNVGSENCPFCRSLNGKVVGMDQYFLGEGEVMYVSDEGQVSIVQGTRSATCTCDPDAVCTCSGGVELRENWQALKSYGPKFHPPIHRGCDCRIVPVIN